jgi:hypothetical protein
MTDLAGYVLGTVVMCRKRHWIGDVYSTSNMLFVPASPGGTVGRMSAISHFGRDAAGAVPEVPPVVPR